MTDELSLNYATALYGLLEMQQRLDALDALKQVVKDMTLEPDFSRLLRSYNLSRAEKAAVIDDVYGKRYSSIPHFISFLKVISDHHRLKSLPRILAAYRTLVHEDIGVKEGIAYSATPLTEQEHATLEEAISKRIGARVSLETVVDHRLLGGVKVAVDGKVFDGTLASKLEDLHRKLNGGIQS